jgi:hypothetical protein
VLLLLLVVLAALLFIAVVTICVQKVGNIPNDV